MTTVGTWTSKSIEVAGCNLVADLRTGAGSPLLFLHGAGSSKVDCRRILDAMEVENPLIVPDSRGHGDSGNGAYELQSWQQLIDDAVAWLDALDVHDAVVAGASMGAVVTPGVVLARPERVSSLAPIFPVYLGSDIPPEPEHWAALSALLQLMSTPDAEAIVASLPDSEQAEARKRLALHRELDGVCAYFRGDRTAGSVPYTSKDLAELTMPVTVIGGADPFHPAHVARQLAAIFPNAALVSMEDVPPIEHESAVAVALGNHLRRYGAGATAISG